MNIASRPAAKDRLHLAALECLKGSQKSVERAAPKLSKLIAGDPGMILELATCYLREVLDRDMNGGGIGLRPVKKTGGDAVADESGRHVPDAHTASARPSAPQSQTPAAMPVGGGHYVRDPRSVSASPPSFVKGYYRPRLAPKASKPRTSLAAMVDARRSEARTLLDTLKVRGRPIGDWTGEEAMIQADLSKWEDRILRAFASGVPPKDKIRDHVTPEDAASRLNLVERSDAA